MSAPQPSPAIGEITAFSTFLQKVEEGQLHADLSRAVEEIVANLNDAYAEARGKPKATLSLKLDFIKDGESIDVMADYSVKTPKVKRQRSVFWATGRNRLSTRNNKQQELDLWAVANNSGAVQSIATEGKVSII